MSLGAMREVAPGVHVQEQELRFFGVELGTRMTILQLEGGLWVHSPVNLDPDRVRHLGELRWVVAPNLFHHLYVGPWIEAGCEGWCAPGLPRKRPDLSFEGVLDEVGSPFGDDLLVVPMRCFSLLNEVVIHHRPSGTLLVSDLLFNISPQAPWMTRAAMWCAGGYPGCRSTWLERVGFNRRIAREEIAFLMDLEFDRVILAHGEIIPSGGRAALAEAYRWLG